MCLIGVFMSFPRADKDAVYGLAGPLDLASGSVTLHPAADGTARLEITLPSECGCAWVDQKSGNGSVTFGQRGRVLGEAIAQLAERGEHGLSVTICRSGDPLQPPQRVTVEYLARLLGSGQAISVGSRFWIRR